MKSSGVLGLVAALMWVVSCPAGASTQVVNSRTHADHQHVHHLVGGLTCTSERAAGPFLTKVQVSTTSLMGNPFGVITNSDGAYIFVSLNSAMAVLSNGTLQPHLVRRIPLPGPTSGAALTHDGLHILIASGGGAFVLNERRTAAGLPEPLEATLQSPGHGAVEVTTSADDRFAFVTLEASHDMAVFNLRAALSGSSHPSLVGMVSLGQAPVGVALSPNGKWLYVTSESGRSGGFHGQGTLSVVSVARAEKTPAEAVVATVAAGCSPVRVVTSADGSTVWVTARGSNALLGFSAKGLLDEPAHAEVADVPVGRAPVGLALVAGDQEVVVADSNRIASNLPTSDLAVVDVRAALMRQTALVGYVHAGRFPRELGTIPGRDASVLVADYASEQLQVVNLAALQP